MFTKEQLLQAIPQVPAEFSIEDLEAILNQPQPSKSTDSVVFPERPANITPKGAADWDRYTSPEAMALYTKFAIPTKIASLRGIAANLPPVDLKKSVKEWKAERIREKYGI